MVHQATKEPVHVWCFGMFPPGRAIEVGDTCGVCLVATQTVVRATVIGVTREQRYCVQLPNHSPEIITDLPSQALFDWSPTESWDAAYARGSLYARTLSEDAWEGVESLAQRSERRADEERFGVCVYPDGHSPWEQILLRR